MPQEELMSPAEWIEARWEEIASYSHVYLAVLPTHPGVFDIDIEVSEWDIVATYTAERASYEEALQIADAIEKALQERGVTVYATRKAWEEYLCPL